MAAEPEIPAAGYLVEEIDDGVLGPLGLDG